MSETKQTNIAYEFPLTTKLEGFSRTFIQIPSSVILNTNMNPVRTLVFSYFFLRRGLDYKFHFSVNEVVKWLNKIPNRTKEGISNKVLQSIKDFKDEGYLTYWNDAFEQIDNSKKSFWDKFVEAELNIDKIENECKQDDETKEYKQYAIIYLDELKRILDYKPEKSDGYSNTFIIYLVFAYLRMMLLQKKRRNTCCAEYLETRRKTYPEAYNCFYFEIADILGISNRAVGKAIGVLKELDLIYSENLPKIRYMDKDNEIRFRTDCTIFCNTYKREYGYLLASGESYYLEEIANKKKRIGCN